MLVMISTFWCCSTYSIPTGRTLPIRPNRYLVIDLLLEWVTQAATWWPLPRRALCDLAFVIKWYEYIRLLIKWYLKCKLRKPVSLLRAPEWYVSSERKESV